MAGMMMMMREGGKGSQEMDETKLRVRRRDGEAACDDGTYGHKGGEEGCREK